MESSTTTVLGVFDDREHAVDAVHALKKAGFTDGQIGVASKEWSQKFVGVSADEQHAAATGAVEGSVIGGGLGAVFGLVGAAFLPGVVPFLAGQVLVSALIGGAAGAAVGAFAGPFIAMGMSEWDAEHHAKLVEQGKTVLLVYAPDRLDEARKILVEKGAYDESMSTSP